MRFAISSFLMLILLSCSTYAYDGNSHGGGGFTTVDAPVSVAQISEAIRASRIEITAWLYSLKADYESYLLTSFPIDSTFGAVYVPARLVPKSNFDPSRTFDRFFPRGAPDIFTSLKSLQIEIRDRHSCLSSISESVDGSFNPSRPTQICISAFRLARKLKLSDYKAQVQALIVHELTHLRGGDEIEAIAVQKLALHDFTSAVLTPISGTYTDYKGKIAPELKDLVSWMAQSSNASEINHLAQAFAIEMRALRDSLETQSFRLIVIDVRLYDHLNQYSKLAQILADYACAQDPQTPPEKRSVCMAEYQSGFGGQDQIAIGEFKCNEWPDDFQTISAILVRKISSREEWKSELNGFNLIIEQVADAVDDVAHSPFEILERP